MLKINHLSKKFGKKQVLNDISYEFRDGIYGLLGPNGAGKTTLIRCILDLYHCPKDIIQLEQLKNCEHEYFGYLPQRFGIFPNLTVEEQLQYFANLKGLDKTMWAGEISRVLELVHLSDERKNKGRKLSGGMVRRIGIAQALLAHPKVLLLDEPTTGLDPEERIRFKNILFNIKNDTTVILSTHIVEDVEAVCDKILIMNKGNIIVEGTQNDIRRYADGKVYEVPRNKVEKNDYIEKEIQVDEDVYVRILTNRVMKDIEPIMPTVEDGYLCILKEI